YLFLPDRAPGFCAPAELAEDIADRDRAHLRARHAGNLEQRHAAAGGLHLDLDLLVVELAGAQLLAEGFFCGGTRRGTGEGVDHAVLRRLVGARLHVLALALARERDR